MESKSSMLKKLAARITTANGDVSAVQGTSISEIIKFMKENLNVADGALKVSELKIPAEPGVGGIIAHFDSNSALFDDSESSPTYYVNFDSNPIPAVEDGAEYVMRFAMNGEEFTVDNLYVKSVSEQPLVSGTAVFMLNKYQGGDYPYTYVINLNSNMLGSTTISGLTIQPWIILGYHYIPGSNYEFAEGGACILACKYLDEGDIFESFEILSIEKA